MGQKLVSVKFNQGSSPDFWDGRYNPVFRLQTNSGSSWIDQTTYYPALTGSITLPVNLGPKEKLTTDVIRRMVRDNQRVSFLVDDSSIRWQVLVKDSFLTAGQEEKLASGSF